MTDQSTEAAVVRDLASCAQAPNPLDVDQRLYNVVVPEGAESHIIDLGDYLQAPDRKRGTTALHTRESFAAFTSDHLTESLRVYADRSEFRIVSVFNDATADEPGWGDHRAMLALRKTPEWLHWEGKSGQFMAQGAFADHIEEGLEEIVEPDAARMLEIAQTFHAKTGVAFKQAITLDSGERQFEFTETVAASAGRKGDVTIPKELKLGIAPFDAEVLAPYVVTARLRYRLREGELSLGYQLIRPQDVLRVAFNDTVQFVADEVGRAPLFGKPRG